MFRIFSRLFLPAYRNKASSLGLVIESSFYAIWFDILPLFTIPLIISNIQENKTGKLFDLILYVLVIYIVLWIVHLFLRKWDFKAKYEYLFWIEKEYRKKVLLKDNQAMEILGTGKLQSVVQKGMYDWVEAVWQILYQIPKVFLTVFTGLYIMRDFGIVFLVLFIISATISSIGFTYFRKKRLKYDTKINELEDDKNAHSVRTIMSRQEVLFSGKEDFETKNLSQYARKQYVLSQTAAKYDFISDWFISGIGSILPFLGVVYVYNSSLVESISAPLLISFIYFSSRFAFNMYSMLWIVKQTLEHLPKIERFWNFLDQVPDMENYETGNKFIHKKGDIDFVNVTFKYTRKFNDSKWFDNLKSNINDEKDDRLVKENDIQDRPILDSFSLRINGGTKLALVGASGSGKTTLAKLIAGYLFATTGSVIVDNQDIAKTSLKSYYKYVGYLTQEPSVFDGSIKENLLYAVDKKDVEQVNNEKIEDALRKAHCEFVFNLKKGINTEIGERGIRLSGGERQRLAIAKLFLKNPEIIILDEPTSALDSFSEEKITQSLEELFKGRTTIIIAHRLQTVKKADRILVIENGKIVEDGNHESLVEQNGVYAKMLSMQSGF